MCDKVTLVINAPEYKGKPGAPNSLEAYFNTGEALGYAIFQKDVSKLSQDSKVVLLRKGKNQKRAEGSFVKLVYTGKTTPQGIKRYDVHFEGQRMVSYKPEKLNRFGVAVF